MGRPTIDHRGRGQPDCLREQSAVSPCVLTVDIVGHCFLLRDRMLGIVRFLLHNTDALWERAGSAGGGFTTWTGFGTDAGTDARAATAPPPAAGS